MAALAYHARALWWYERALPDLDGLARTRVAKRPAAMNIPPAHRLPPDIGLAEPDSIPVGEVRRYPYPGDLRHMAPVPGGRGFLAAGLGGNVVWYELAGGRVLLQEKKGGDNFGVAVSPDARRAICGGADSMVHVLDLKTKQWSQFPTKDGILYTPTFFPDGHRVLYGTQWGSRIFDLDSKQRVLVMQGTYWATGTAMSADGRLVLTANPDGSRSADLSLHLLDGATGKEIRPLAGQTNQATTAAISPDGRFGLTGSDENVVRLWDLQTGRVLRRLVGYGVAFVGNGRYALTGGADVRLWRVPCGELLASYPIGARCLCPLPDNRFVLCGQQGTICLWRLPLTKTGRFFAGTVESDGKDETARPMPKQKESSEVTRPGQ